MIVVPTILRMTSSEVVRARVFRVVDTVDIWRYNSHVLYGDAVDFKVNYCHATTYNTAWRSILSTWG